MLTLRHNALSHFTEPNHTLQDLYMIFSETLNKSMTYEDFHLYYFQHEPHYMDISFIMDHDHIVGFICASFYKHQLSKKTYTICRGATGLKDEYRGGNLPSWHLCRKYIRYKLRHPFEEMFIIAYIANPIVYSMICKHTQTVYPKAGIHIPMSIHQLSDDLLAFHGFQEKVIARFILKIHFQVHINANDEKRIYSSKDKDVRYYLKLNPDFQKQTGVLTIIPVTWINMLVSVMRSLIKKPVSMFIRNKLKTMPASGVITFLHRNTGRRLTVDGLPGIAANKKPAGDKLQQSFFS